MEREIERKRRRETEREERRKEQDETEERYRTDETPSLPRSLNFLSCFLKTKREDSVPVVRAGLFVIVCKLWLIPHYRY